MILVSVSGTIHTKLYGNRSFYQEIILGDLPTVNMSSPKQMMSCSTGSPVMRQALSCTARSTHKMFGDIPRWDKEHLTTSSRRNPPSVPNSLCSVDCGRTGHLVSSSSEILRPLMAPATIPCFNTMSYLRSEPSMVETSTSKEYWPLIGQ